MLHHNSQHYIFYIVHLIHPNLIRRNNQMKAAIFTPQASQWRELPELHTNHSLLDNLHKAYSNRLSNHMVHTRLLLLAGVYKLKQSTVAVVLLDFGKAIPHAEVD